MPYESLLKEADQLGIYTYEKPMHPKLKGLYADNVICINSLLPTCEKVGILAEEIEHYHTSYGNSLDQSKTENRKQEIITRTKIYKRLVPLSKLVQAHHEGIRNHYELAEYLGISENLLRRSLKRYQEIYGTHTKHNEYTIYFEPLIVIDPVI